MDACRVLGIQQVCDKLRAEGLRISTEALDAGLEAASQMMKEAISFASRSIAKDPPGQPNVKGFGPIYRNIFAKRVEQGLAQKPGEITYQVGVSNKAFYGFFWEYGYMTGGITHRSRAGGKSVTKHLGAGVRHIPARPFVRATFDARIGDANKIIEDAIRNAVEKGGS